MILPENSIHTFLINKSNMMMKQGGQIVFFPLLEIGVEIYMTSTSGCTTN